MFPPAPLASVVPRLIAPALLWLRPIPPVPAVTGAFSDIAPVESMVTVPTPPDASIAAPTVIVPVWSITTTPPPVVIVPPPALVKFTPLLWKLPPPVLITALT